MKINKKLNQLSNYRIFTLNALKINLLLAVKHHHFLKESETCVLLYCQGADSWLTFSLDQPTVYGELSTHEPDNEDSLTIQASDGFDVKNVTKVKSSLLNT